jgi:multidrug efflux pump subunit AcrA (membrane-fusion protein)
MPRVLPAVVLAVVVFLLLAGCGRKAAAPAPDAALVRPVVTLRTDSARVRVPQAALIERGGITGVFVLAADGVARFRLVRTGKRSDGRVEVLSGLSGDETLVLGDLGNVRDGSPIKTQ